MDKFKIEIYQRENRGETLPIKALGKEKSVLIFHEIKSILDVNKMCDTQSFYLSADNVLPNLIKYDDEIDNLAIYGVLIKELGLSLDSNVFIFWDCETPIDTIKVNVLIDNWDYIWYDSSDEAILIYNDDKRRIALITEKGYIKTN